MSTQTSIEWTERTWNPTTGCNKISPGCANCYAEKMARRLQAMGVPGYENGFELTMIPSRLKEPLKRRKPTIYFVNSMSDLFHQGVTDSYIGSVIDTIQQVPHHTFQLLTKRAERMKEYFLNRDVPDNLWLGVTVEDRNFGLPRIDYLRQIQAPVRFLSIEPLLEDLGQIDLSGIHWTIVGGESGPRARQMKQQWVQSIKDQCHKQASLFFFKQWGAWGADGIKRVKKKNGRFLNGSTWDDSPSHSKG